MSSQTVLPTSRATLSAGCAAPSLGWKTSPSRTLSHHSGPILSLLRGHAGGLSFFRVTDQVGRPYLALVWTLGEEVGEEFVGRDWPTLHLTLAPRPIRAAGFSRRLFRPIRAPASLPANLLVVAAKRRCRPSSAVRGVATNFPGALGSKHGGVHV